MRFLRFLYQSILNIIFPSTCYNCGINDDYLCEPCAVMLKPKTHQQCIVCGKLSMDGFTHPKCQTRYTPERLVTIFGYDSFPVSRLITDGKYRFIPRIFARLGNIMSAHLSLPHTAVVVPIPLHKRRMKWRGFNQAELIAKEIAGLHKLTLRALIKRVKFSSPQNGLDKEKRHSNISGVYECLEVNNTPTLVLLIDDVCTTGSTFLEATKTIKKVHKQTRVWCLAIAQD